MLPALAKSDHIGDSVLDNCITRYLFCCRRSTNTILAINIRAAVYSHNSLDLCGIKKILNQENVFAKFASVKMLANETKLITVAQFVWK